MIKIFSILLLLFVAQLSLANDKKPAWVLDNTKACKTKTELCAVGEGDSNKKAESAAKVALSKIFDLKISSNFSSDLKSQGSDVEESMSEQINEATDMALSGVEISKRAEDKTSFYALAIINKAKAARGFEKEIESIDEQMKAIASSGEDIEKVKLERLYVKRETLNRQVQFLVGRSIASPLSYEEVFSAKRNAGNNVVIHIYLDEDEPKRVEGVLAKVISDAGFKTTSGRTRNPNSTHVITGEFAFDKEYMKVDGFEKYRYVLNIKAMKAKLNVESGRLHFEISETGRNFSQATDHAIPKIQEYLEKNIEKLNLR